MALVLRKAKARARSVDHCCDGEDRDEGHCKVLQRRERERAEGGESFCNREFSDGGWSVGACYSRAVVHILRVIGAYS